MGIGEDRCTGAIMRTRLMQRTLQKFSRELECKVCSSTYSNPVQLPCSHLFCQDCVDTLLSSKKATADPVCPCCLQPFWKPDLVNNQTFKSIVDAFQDLYEFVGRPEKHSKSKRPPNVLSDTNDKDLHRSKSKRKRVFFNSDPPATDKENMGPFGKKSSELQNGDKTSNLESEQIEFVLTPESGGASADQALPDADLEDGQMPKEGDIEMQTSEPTFQGFSLRNFGIGSNDNANSDRKTSSLSLSGLIAADSIDEGTDVDIPLEELQREVESLQKEVDTIDRELSKASGHAVNDALRLLPCESEKEKSTTNALSDPRQSSSTSTPTSRGRKIKRIECVRLGKAEEEVIKSACTFLGGASLSRSHCANNTTHIIAEVDKDGYCKSKSVSYLIGLCSGAWVITIEWVKQSHLAGRWLPECDFEVFGDRDHPGGPSRARGAFLEGEELFSELCFIFVGEFLFPTPTLQVMHTLVDNGGGTVLDEADRDEFAERGFSIIYVIGQCSDDSVYRGSTNRVNCAWVMKCISAWKLLPLSLDVQSSV